jgi:eukaryotic-like serine/threonine-protein kinase
MGAYHLREHLGSGAFGSVHSCVEVDEHDVVIQDDIAIKFLKDEWLDDDHVRDRFRNEARFLRELDHPNILPVIYSNLSASTPFIVTRLAESNLQSRLDENASADRDWVLLVFAGVLAGVAHAHDQQVLHRDLKPANVLFLGGVPVVSDFGMGKDLSEDATRQTATNAHIGTPGYMAPELWGMAREATKPTDVFALGKMLWELLTGRPPLPGPPDLDVIDDDALRDFIERCCQAEPPLRYGDASEALQAWKALSGTIAPAQLPLEHARQLSRDWIAAPEGKRVRVLRRLDDLLSRRRDDEQFYYSFVPYILEDIVAQYAAVLPDRFETVVGCYIGHVAGQLPFSYCDDAAGFYVRVFQLSPDPDLRRTVLAELLDLGERHQRYAVADEVRALLWSISDEAIAQLAAAVITQTPASGWYRHGRLYERPLAPVLEKAFSAL